MSVGLALYDLETDAAETTDCSDENPDVVARMKTLADRMRQKLGDTLTRTQGSEIRGPGRLPSG